MPYLRTAMQKHGLPAVLANSAPGKHDEGSASLRTPGRLQNQDTPGLTTAGATLPNTTAVHSSLPQAVPRLSTRLARASFYGNRWGGARAPQTSLRQNRCRADWVVTVPTGQQAQRPRKVFNSLARLAPVTTIGAAIGGRGYPARFGAS